MKEGSDLHQGTGSLQGIDIDIIKLVMKEIGIPFNIRLIKSGSRIIKEAKSGNVDMVLSFSKKKDRTYLKYPDNSYKDVSWNFFIRKENLRKITYESFNDLRGLIVGATQDWSYTKEFWNSGLDFSIVTNDKQQLLMLYRGRIDVVPLNTISAIYEINQDGYSDDIIYLPKSLKSKPYFNAFVTNSDYPNKEKIMGKYDSIISRMKRDGTLQKIFNKYLKSKP
jgi:polar amino acid transport system substrate-binding protein